MLEEIYCSKYHNKQLSCEHNLCILCAAENLSRQESKGINKTQLVICDLSMLIMTSPALIPALKATLLRTT